MEEVSKATFKVGIKFVVDNGKFFIQIGDALLEFARLPPALQKIIEDTVFSSIVTSAKMFPYLSFLATLFMAYRLREAENSAERSATQAAEAQAQAAEAVRKAQEQINSGREFTVPFPVDNFQSIRQQIGLEAGRHNIAVVGRVSSGKTSMINSIRGLRRGLTESQVPEDPAYSLGQVGTEEMNQGSTKYRDHNHTNTIWWDMPGTGGLHEREWTYSNRYHLGVYDTLLILHDGPLSRCELNIIIQHREQTNELPREVHDPRIFTIRTKCDETLARIGRDEGLTGSEAVEHLKRTNTDSVTALLSQEGLQNGVIIRHISLDALYDAVTGANLNANGARFDEEELLHDLGLRTNEPPIESPFIYDGSVSGSDVDDLVL